MGSYAMSNGRVLRFSSAAQECIDETGTDPIDDVDSLRRNTLSLGADRAKSRLLADVLDGADDDRKQGWYQYVDAIVDFVNVHNADGSFVNP